MEDGEWLSVGFKLKDGLLISGIKKLKTINLI